MRLGDNERALASFHQAVEYQETSTNLLALAHGYLEKGHYRTARQWVERALALDSNISIYHLSHAVVCWLQGEIESAQSHLAEAMRRDRHIMNAKKLQFDYFWGPRALEALDQLLAAKR